MNLNLLPIYIIMASPIVFFFGMAYGDYQTTGKWPWTREKKDKVNSGAKFG